MATIFINYRRSDAEAHAGRLYDSLMIQLAGAKIFMDVDSLEAGENFVETLKATLWSADLMLVVVGRTWSTAADATGMRRLDNADDFVRLEIANALSREMHIIPVLVQSASMPSIHELPDEIKDLAYRQAIEIRHNRWTDDVSHLVDRIESLLNSSTEAGLIRHDTSSVKGTRGARVRRAWTGLLRKIGLGSERSAFRRRNRRHYHLYRAGTIAVVVLVTFAGYQWYRYAREADERAVGRLADRIRYENPEEEVLAAVLALRNAVVRANDAAVTQTAVTRLKAVVLTKDDTTEKGRRIRKSAIEMVKTLRNNDLTLDFRGDDLAPADLVEVDLRRVNLKGVNLEDSFLLRTDFSGADLSGANLSGAYVRNADFSGVTLTGANVQALDWFNAGGFSASQLRSVDLTTLGPCPKDPKSGEHTESAFRARVDQEYGFDWEGLYGPDKLELGRVWSDYTKRGALCDQVDKWLAQ